MKTVKKEHVLHVLKWLRDVRIRAIKKNISPWALRQGLLLVLQIDTTAALERGVTAEKLEEFDRLAVTPLNQDQIP